MKTVEDIPVMMRISDYTVAVRIVDKIIQTENLNSNKMLSRAAQSIQDKKVDQQNIKHKERWNNAL